MKVNYSIHTTVFFTLLSYRLSFTTYRVIAEWLGAYTYILPAQRQLYEPLIPLLLEYLIRKHGSLKAGYAMAEVVPLLHSNVTLANQLQLHTLIKEALNESQ